MNGLRTNSPFDRLGRDILTVGKHDDILFPVGDFNKPIFINNANVACVKPPIFVQSPLPVCRVVVEVPLHHVWTAG